MNGIEDLKLMLESRSTDYGKMRNILSGYLLNVDSRVAKLKTTVKELVDENEALLAKLKVAEDALNFAWMYADKLPHQWPLPERVRTKMKNALAAIRKEGGAK